VERGSDLGVFNMLPRYLSGKEKVNGKVVLLLQ
jgi:hypothetical protein